ncbi:MAG: HAMP domain-containing sensor histidine kinase [Patescibacteria group bacterium]
MNFLKRFVEWGTGLRRRFTSDVFFRTTWVIIGLQTALILLLFGFFALGISFASSNTTFALGVGPIALIFILGIAVAILFGVVLVRLAIRPARSSLDTQKLFISNIAHELRTPLSVIKTTVEVELLDEEIEKPLQKTLTTVLEEIDRASGVINNLLSLNRLLRPQRVEWQEVDLAPIVDRVLARSNKVAFERGIDLLVSRGESTTVRGNPVALEQLIINLTNNAIQYTPKNSRGRITITMRPDGEPHMLMLSVADNGIGIAKEDLSHILEPFYRGDKSRARNIKDGGSGLGLAIVSEIVRAHGGQVRINSTQGKGTVVTVLLPRVEPRRSW